MSQLQQSPTKLNNSIIDSTLAIASPEKSCQEDDSFFIPETQAAPALNLTDEHFIPETQPQRSMFSDDDDDDDFFVRAADDYNSCQNETQTQLLDTQSFENVMVINTTVVAQVHQTDNDRNVREGSITPDQDFDDLPQQTENAGVVDNSKTDHTKNPSCSVSSVNVNKIDKSDMADMSSLRLNETTINTTNLREGSITPEQDFDVLPPRIVNNSDSNKKNHSNKSNVIDNSNVIVQQYQVKSTLTISNRTDTSTTTVDKTVASNLPEKNILSMMDTQPFFEPELSAIRNAPKSLSPQPSKKGKVIISYDLSDMLTQPFIEPNLPAESINKKSSRNSTNLSKNKPIIDDDFLNMATQPFIEPTDFPITPAKQKPIRTKPSVNIDEDFLNMATQPFIEPTFSSTPNVQRTSGDPIEENDVFDMLTQRVEPAISTSSAAQNLENIPLPLPMPEDIKKKIPFNDDFINISKEPYVHPVATIDENNFDLCTQVITAKAPTVSPSNKENHNNVVAKTIKVQKPLKKIVRNRILDSSSESENEVAEEAENSPVFVTAKTAPIVVGGISGYVFLLLLFIKIF